MHRHMTQTNKTVHDKTTSYVEIRNHVSFKAREFNVQFVGGQKTYDHVMKSDPVFYTPFFVNALRGLAISEKPLMNRQ